MHIKIGEEAMKRGTRLRFPKSLLFCAALLRGWIYNHIVGSAVGGREIEPPQEPSLFDLRFPVAVNTTRALAKSRPDDTMLGV